MRLISLALLSRILVSQQVRKYYCATFKIHGFICGLQVAFALIVTLVKSKPYPIEQELLVDA